MVKISQNTLHNAMKIFNVAVSGSATVILSTGLSCYLAVVIEKTAHRVQYHFFPHWYKDVDFALGLDLQKNETLNNRTITNTVGATASSSTTTSPNTFMTMYKNENAAFCDEIEIKKEEKELMVDRDSIVSAHHFDTNNGERRTETIEVPSAYISSLSQGQYPTVHPSGVFHPTLNQSPPSDNENITNISRIPSFLQFLFNTSGEYDCNNTDMTNVLQTCAMTA